MGVVQSQAKDRPSSYSSRMSAESYPDAKSVRGTSLVCSWFLGGAGQVTCSEGVGPRLLSPRKDRLSTLYRQRFTFAYRLYFLNFGLPLNGLNAAAHHTIFQCQPLTKISKEGTTHVCVTLPADSTCPH